MPSRIALLLCALLVLSGCASTAYAAAPVWSAEESAYMQAVLPSINALPTVLLTYAANPRDNDAHAAVQTIVDTFAARPAAPATLAVIDLYTAYSAAACSNALHTGSVAGARAGVNLCSEQLRVLQLELARLYAARGAYPPGYVP